MTFFKTTCKQLYRFGNELASAMDDEMAGDCQANRMLVKARRVMLFTSQIPLGKLPFHGFLL